MSKELKAFNAWWMNSELPNWQMEDAWEAWAVMAGVEA